MHPFIEAERSQGANVKRTCELLEVFRGRLLPRTEGRPERQGVRGRQAGEEDRRGPQFVQLHLRVAPGPCRTAPPRGLLWAPPGGPAHEAARPEVNSEHGDGRCSR